MKRSRAEFPPRDALTALLDSEGRVVIRVTPGARTESLTLNEGGLAAKVRAKPQDGAANEAVRKLLAAAYGVPPSRVALLHGATSREKLFRIDR
ncbi:DUF167 domain-containing protein [Qipengyuania aurantiaca]|uniref:UPF0235 protein K3148_05205 n=1 Tax=Qipengyuania aurantiaca TaxID=2867233 RepID=A0ABX8ZPC9_9SPHN|nr:DUF167 domain-containing protein [Qipengyuania aurantiaca]QZD90789.1 DUF167 domain-containing protein [Qipengyuania aurantiaca]